jgi:hypothetical protein
MILYIKIINNGGKQKMYTWGYLKDASLAKLDLDEQEANERDLLSKFPFWANEVITDVCSAIKPNRTFVDFVITSDDIGTLFTMPNDFISFGDDVNTVKFKDEFGDTWLEEAHDDDFAYKGYNKLMFWKEGIYSISYNARWITFDKNMDNNATLDIPTDILECIPSYIACQGFKMDDETKSALFRNEYEMKLARIDDTDYKQTKTFKIRGNW